MHSYNLCGTDSYECSFFCGDKENFTAWIDYDSGSKMVEVRYRNGSLETSGGIIKPADALLAVSDVVLDEVLDEVMFVGFSSNTLTEGSPVVHRLRSWNFNSSGIMLAPSSSPVLTPPAGTGPSSAPVETTPAAGTE